MKLRHGAAVSIAGSPARTATLHDLQFGTVLHLETPHAQFVVAQLWTAGGGVQYSTRKPRVFCTRRRAVIAHGASVRY